MDTSLWKRKIDAAPDPGAVVKVVQDFLYSLETVELATLPPGTRPLQIHTPGDVSQWAFDLSTARLANVGNGDGGILGDICLVITDAARRLLHVMPREGFTGWDAELEDPSEDSGTWVLVYDYEYWDPAKERMVRADRSSTLEAIKNGLGQPILSTGRKVRLAQLDSSGFAAAPRQRDTAGDIST